MNNCGSTNVASDACELDVIVPVYRGYEETRACLESLWAASQKTQYRLVVINDATPDKTLTCWLRDVAQNRPMLLLENASNLGFAATVNRGMALSSTADVVLLNSDTEVAGNWLDRMRVAAYAKVRTGTVTPFSNNATICSYPRILEDNALPASYSLTRLDSLFAEANAGATVGLPTAVGFCMYIRRACLEDVGLFDHITFAAGYAEENDFCLRASRRGWRHVLACDTFVWHKGNVSFGAGHNTKKLAAHEVLIRAHKTYEVIVQRHIATDPARRYRNHVDVLRLKRSSLPRILFISHALGGGTEKHIRDLVAYVKEQAHFLVLKPEAGDQVSIEWLDASEGLKFWFALPDNYDALCAVLRDLGVSRVHIHHTLGVPRQVFDILADMDLPWDFTAHDYYPLCPQITMTRSDNRYCGEPDESGCDDCLRKNPAPGRVAIRVWRNNHRTLIEKAQRVFCPSAGTMHRYHKRFPGGRYVVAPHTDMECLSVAPVSALLPVNNRSLRIAVLGALSPEKGGDLLEAAATDAHARKLPLQFRLFGYAYRHLKDIANLSVTGPYLDADLNVLLSAWKPDIVWFPALWPETYSYTLSACLAAGLPVAATNLGAIAERLVGRPYSWLQPWETSAKDWNNFFLQLAGGRACVSVGNGATVRQAPDRSATFTYIGQYVETKKADGQPQVLRLDLQNQVLFGQWVNYIYRRLHGWRAIRMMVGQKVLLVLVRLRSYPATRSIARRIPMHTQRWVKRWLLSAYSGDRDHGFWRS